MVTDPIEQLRQKIIGHPTNRQFTKQGWVPLFAAATTSRVAIIGQAPGIRAQTAGLAWDDASGQRLISWLGITEAQFRDPSLFALLPMDFYYQGKGKSGDLPPRPDFAPRWHKQFLDIMPNLHLIVLIGQYSQKYYLAERRQRNLTETVRDYRAYLPTYFPLVHPSPLNFRWQAKNPWFESELIPVLQKTIKSAIS